MADFVAVLRKTIDGLADNTPAIREKVYEKARATVAAKLAAINPPPPSAVAERQKRALEDAINQVEAGYSGGAEDPFDELENVFADLTRKQPAEAKAAPAVQPPSPPPVQVEARPPIQPKAPQPNPVNAPPPIQAKAPPPNPAKAPPPIQAKAPPLVLEKAPPPVQAKAPLSPEPKPPVLLEPRPEEPDLPESQADHNGWFQPPESEQQEPAEAHDDHHVISFDADEHEQEVPEQRSAFEEPRRRRSFAPLIAAVAVLALLAGGGYAVWLNKNDFMAMLGIEGGKPTVAAAPSTDNAKPQAPRPAAAKAPAAEDVQKFTQRLKSDGTETDGGPAGGAPSIGEGTSMATVTQPPAPARAVPPPAAPQQAAPAPADAHPAAPPAGSTGPAPATNPAMPAAPAAPATQTATGQPAGAEGQVAVGQKAIFYEERTNVAAGSAEPGSVVWSLVQESPGDDQPAEPAIRGEATIPGKDLQLRVTIRRNADKTLPASHIIELIFLTPENFDGGGIENILRFALKDTEEAAGSPLLGIPAKIADGFFLIALNDTKAEIATNLNLLKREKWIDVPLVYKSGRRALFTMEKGIPGDKVFDEVIKAWESAAASAG